MTEPPPPVTWPDSLAIDCQYRRPAPEGVFQGSGVLAVDPGNAGPVRVFGAIAGLPDGVPVIQAVLSGSALVISADAPVAELASPAPGGLPAALGRWADGFSSGAGLPRAPVMPPMWCSWYQYFSDVTERDVLANLDAMASLDLPVGIVQIDGAGISSFCYRRVWLHLSAVTVAEIETCRNGVSAALPQGR